jgi:hypothetical protein
MPNPKSLTDDEIYSNEMYKNFNVEPLPKTEEYTDKNLRNLTELSPTEERKEESIEDYIERLDKMTNDELLGVSKKPVEPVEPIEPIEPTKSIRSNTKNDHGNKNAKSKSKSKSKRSKRSKRSRQKRSKRRKRRKRSTIRK